MVSPHLISAKETADLLGVSLRRAYQLKDRLGGRKIQGQGQFFDRRQVIAFKGKREMSTDPRVGQGSIVGNVAGTVFAALEQKKLPIQIVIEFSLPPDVVMNLAEAHAQIAGGVLLSKIHLDAIGTLPGLVSWPNPTPDDFVSMLQDTVTVPQCAKCVKRPAKVCLSCGGR